MNKLKLIGWLMLIGACSDRATETAVESPELRIGNYYMLVTRSLDTLSINRPDTLFKARMTSETTFVNIKGEVEYQILPFVCGEGECEE